MATYLSNRDSGGYTNENGHFRLPLKMLDGEIFSGFEVKQLASASMKVNITAGEAKVPYLDYAYAVWADADTTLTIPTANATNSRYDVVVAYVDRTMSFTTSDTNNPGALKFKVVSGTASASPAVPNATAIQSSVGAGNPWIYLAVITVGAGTTQITDANIDTSVQTHTSLSQNIENASIKSTDGNNLIFSVINDGDPLPSAVEGKTLIVFVTSD